MSLAPYLVQRKYNPLGQWKTVGEAMTREEAIRLRSDLAVKYPLVRVVTADDQSIIIDEGGWG